MIEFERFRPHKRFLLVLIILVLVVGGTIALLSGPSEGIPGSAKTQIHDSLAADITQFQQMTPKRGISLPDDFRFHVGYRQEWWHFFADVVDQEGQRYSVKWHYYRVAMNSRNASGWENPQLYIATTVITSGQRVWRAQRLARGGIGQAGFRERPFRLWLDNWSWRSLGLMPFPGLLNVNGDGFAVQLNSTAAGPYVLDGKQGYQEKRNSPSVGSYQFRAPFLNVAGDLILDGVPVSVRGTATLSKEWGNRILNQGPEHQDQFFLRFHNGMTLLINRFSYPLQSTTYFGTLAQRDGSTVHLDGSDIHIFPESYTELIEGHQFPARWIIVIPKYNIRLTVVPRESGQWHPFLIPLWEGGITASGTHNATGYMYFSGY
jgi:predicted secreted hydrolase